MLLLKKRTPMDDLDIAKDRADWMLDAIAGATQNRQFLRGDPAYDEVAGKAILLNGEKAINVALSKKDAEITRLRAALADAQAVGFAAGVEAAAKVAAMQAVYTREAIKRATASELVSNLVTVTKSITAHDIEIAIRALTPPDAIAAAARVLLGVWPTDDSFRAAFDACAARYHGGDQMQDEMDRTRATVSAALRAIAGDTP